MKMLAPRKFPVNVRGAWPHGTLLFTAAKILLRKQEPFEFSGDQFMDPTASISLQGKSVPGHSSVRNRGGSQDLHSICALELSFSNISLLLGSYHPLGHCTRPCRKSANTNQPLWPREARVCISTKTWMAASVLITAVYLVSNSCMFPSSSWHRRTGHAGIFL